MPKPPKDPKRAPTKGEKVGSTRREALSSVAALGLLGGASSCASADDNAAGSSPFPGRIGQTLDESTPHYVPRTAAQPGAPNVILIVLDDVGFSDLGCYGGEIETPAIDALASGGLRYVNFRTTGVCSATRASLLTGLNPHSAGIGWLTFDDAGFPGYRGDLSRHAATLAETLNEAGYVSYHSGKWHVNAATSTSATGPVENWPLQRGYARSYWFQGHSTDFFRPSQVYDGNERISIDRDDYYATDDFSDRAITYIRDHVAQDPDTPFFLTLAHAAAHSPLQAVREDIDAERGNYNEGWDRIREQRLARQIDLGVVAPQTQLPQRNPGIDAWDDLSTGDRQLYARYMEVYAAMIRRVDMNTAKLIDTLETLGILDNTLIIVLSDNGGSPDGGLKGTTNLLAGRSGGVTNPQALAQLEDIGGPDTYVAYPAGWAMASNTPFRLYKHDTHLGGVADPLIVHWPRAIAQKGELRNQYVHAVDVLPTILECAGARPLDQLRGLTTKPVQGVSFASTFESPDAAETRHAQHFELSGLRAYYADGWRLVSKGRYGQPDDGWELFDVRQDCNETNDLAAGLPERVAALEARWSEAAREFDVLPINSQSNFRKSFAGFFAGGGRTRWELRPPIDLVPEEASPALVGRSHTIDIELAPTQRSDQGVLFAYGNMFLGVVLYVHDGQLIYEAAATPHTIKMQARLAEGATHIRFTHTLTARPWRGVNELFVDSVRVAAHEPDHFFFGRPMQGLQIGRNDAVPVSNAYTAPDPYSGVIRRVVVTLDNSPYSDEEIAATAAPPSVTR